MSFVSGFDAFHEQAVKASGGLTDFGGNQYHEPLRILLQDIDRNAALSELGEQIVAGNIVGDLSARLFEEQGYKTFPQYVSTSIKKPLIITGMARTGTTVLHRLMALDPALQTLPLWLACAPIPRPPRDTWESNTAYLQVQQGVDQVQLLSPKFNQIHPQSAAAPDECRIIINHSFYSPTYAAMAYVPEYTEMLKANDGLGKYHRYRKTLGLIGGGSNKRWLLKCPTHLWNLPALLDIFPDACIVMTHRDPVNSITSIVSLTYELIKMAAPTITPEVFAKEHSETWGWILNKAERDRESIEPARIFDIHFDDIRSNPIVSIERIYRHFEIPVSDEARSLWQRQVAEDPHGGHAVHRYKPEDFGMTANAIRRCAGACYDRYLKIEKARASVV